MREVSLFGEDAGHQVVVEALLARLSAESDVSVRVTSLSSTGGIVRVHHEFGIYLRDIEAGKLSTPDLIIVATDGNCKGHTARRQEIERVADRHPGLRGIVSYAIPDPHVERWLLADPAAFKAVLGRGCNLPANKCEKDFYKRLLAREVQEAGVKPILGGLEYADEIVAALDFPTVERSDGSFERLLRDLRASFNQWRYQQHTRDLGP